MSYTTTEKRKAIERELKIRRSVYPGRVARKRMSQAFADYQIAIFEQIHDDYIRENLRKIRAYQYQNRIGNED